MCFYVENHDNLKINEINEINEGYRITYLSLLVKIIIMLSNFRGCKGNVHVQ